MKKIKAKTTENNCSKNSGGNRNTDSLPFRLLDFVIITAVVLISLTPLLFLNGNEGKTVVISWRGQEIYRDDISKDQTIVTPDGRNTVVIKDGSVRMLNAECRDHICVKAGEATPSKPIVCLPNRVVVSIIGTEEVDSGTW